MLILGLISFPAFSCCVITADLSTQPFSSDTTVSTLSKIEGLLIEFSIRVSELTRRSISSKEETKGDDFRVSR